MPNNTIAQEAQPSCFNCDAMSGGLYRDLHDAVVTNSEARNLTTIPLAALAHEAERGEAEGLPEFDDPAVSVVYNILCDDVAPPPGEHWEGWCARKIIAALKAREQPAPTTPAPEHSQLWRDVINDELHPKTLSLVRRMAYALAVKLRTAEAKYGYEDGWANSDWVLSGECREKLTEHIEKGDPLDVIAYAAFLWHHGASTAPEPEALEDVLEKWRPALRQMLPAPEQPARDERAAFEAEQRKHLHPSLAEYALTLDAGDNSRYVVDATEHRWIGWQARAALAQPAPEQSAVNREVRATVDSSPAQEPVASDARIVWINEYGDGHFGMTSNTREQADAAAECNGNFSAPRVACHRIAIPSAANPKGAPSHVRPFPPSPDR